ncbi:hypothetical protein GJ633_04145 [Halorubrum sp. CBA1125]|uniref:hypothetical protein n=1 Tax=Halorubrum sp. CBA1125 TaxID=2668072 RepID=UPI0012E70D28|nr:hypothetical protein [Halorubrum sp. CBA1125]MUW13943.1 hypothetical protein [Halorubrum sp. CBA1125]
MPSEQHTDVVPRSDGWADSGPREAQSHPGIHGSYHRYDVIEWSEPSGCEYTADYAKPYCPVGELATADDGSACGMICERIGVEGGSGAWRCPLHGYFRVFDYPAEPERETEQATLLTDGGRVQDTEGTDQPYVGYPFKELEQTHDGLGIDCPDCADQHLVARYLRYGCPNSEETSSPILLYPYECDNA